MIKLIILILFIPLVAHSGIGLMFDNDIFGATDRYYTHGTRLSYRYNDLEYSLSQFMYTPKDISIPYLQPNDRPYCGWLFLGINKSESDEETYTSWEINIGTTGPNSFADETQTFVHKYTDNIEPQWNNQIKNEIGINLIHNRKYRIYRNNWFDYTHSFNASLGNIFTHAITSIDLRAGLLPETFYISKLEPVYRVYRPRVKNNIIQSLYGILSLEQKLVLRDISLDGNTFRQSHSVPKNNFVSQVDTGIGLDIYNVSILYVYTIRTKEFKYQEDIHKFGRISIVYNF